MAKENNSLIEPIKRIIDASPSNIEKALESGYETPEQRAEAIEKLLESILPTYENIMKKWSEHTIPISHMPSYFLKKLAKHYMLEAAKVEKSKRPDKQKISNLEKVFSKFGIEVKRYVDEYGIDPSHIMEYKQDSQGNTVFLCFDDSIKGKLLFYVLRATSKSENWKKIASEYKAT